MNGALSPFGETCAIHDMQVVEDKLIIFTIDGNQDNIIVVYDIKDMTKLWERNVGKIYREKNLRDLVDSPKGNYLIVKNKIFLTHKEKIISIDIPSGLLKTYIQKTYKELNVPEEDILVDPENNYPTSYKEWLAANDKYLFRLRRGSPLWIDIFDIKTGDFVESYKYDSNKSIVKAVLIGNNWFLFSDTVQMLTFDLNSHKIINDLYVGNEPNACRGRPCGYLSLNCFQLNSHKDLLAEIGGYFYLVAYPYQKAKYLGNTNIQSWNEPEFINGQVCFSEGFLAVSNNTLLQYSFREHDERFRSKLVKNVELSGIYHGYNAVTRYKGDLLAGLTNDELYIMRQDYSIIKKYKIGSLWDQGWRDPNYFYSDPDGEEDFKYSEKYDLFFVLRRQGGFVKAFKISN